MKNTFFTLLGVLPLLSYGQFPAEDFENFTLVPNNWGFVDYAGFYQRWAPTGLNNPDLPAYAGNQAIYIEAGTMPQGQQTDDWLITPRFTAQAGTQLEFFSRMLQEGDQGSICGVYISTNEVQLYPEGFEQLQQWTETQLNPDQLDYNQVTVQIPEQYVGQQVYLAFRMRTNGGDSWLIDNAAITAVLNSTVFDLESIRLYPNPTTNVLNIDTANNVLQLVTIYDVNGRHCLTSKSHEIDMQFFSAGVYVVAVETEGGTGHYKFIKQ